ncbi:DUF4097 family beta strand repeat-containing protein [Chryseobacterium geocarposphaerae]|uniref:Uncharacterized protein n=1 Tax=Chryseobacterium geocarposphaerae TaxID=1416776 RepID=A0A2M9C8X9_9FLAO|nr:DUF4097 family beta strand repeat-containing protein [Chryseobacterium geocarposphaerae]PJJ67266.1 hypothetical protein CLV73_1268 [Chryseobacterium geocarposphaerae]
MKKVFLIMFALMAFSFQAQENLQQTNFTQENSKTYKIKKSKGKLLLNLGKVTVEGYKGNEIVFSVQIEDDEEDKRAEGLQIINALGLTDNTGLGINVSEKDGILEVNSLKKMSFPDLKILVPENIIVSFKHQSQYGGDVVFKNMQNEIEVATTYNNIQLENITGPATIKSIYGKIEAVFNQNVKGPLSIISVYGLTDVTLPKSIKANLKTTTKYGEIYVSPDFKIDVEKKEDLPNLGSDLAGKINGGGNDVEVRSDYSKIYLRAK